MPPVPENAVDRRERRRLELRERVLEAASELFEEHGYDGTKVSDICTRAEIAYGTFFNHFSGKGDLVLGLADQAISDFSLVLEDVSKAEGTIEEQLLLLFGGIAAELEPARREVLELIWKTAVAETPVDTDSRFHAAFESFLAEAITRGSVRGDVPVETLAEVVGGTFSAMILNWLHLDDYPLSERATAAARFLAVSLAAPASVSSSASPISSSTAPTIASMTGSPPTS